MHSSANGLVPECRLVSADLSGRGSSVADISPRRVSAPASARFRVPVGSSPIRTEPHFLGITSGLAAIRPKLEKLGFPRRYSRLMHERIVRQRSSCSWLRGPERLHGIEPRCAYSGQKGARTRNGKSETNALEVEPMR
jgi:hypothetical protein